MVYQFIVEAPAHRRLGYDFWDLVLRNDPFIRCNPIPKFSKNSAWILYHILGKYVGQFISPLKWGGFFPLRPKFTYNADNRILTATDAAGTVIFTDTYDAKGRVATQDDALSTNQLTRFSYDEQSQPGKLITTVTERTGATRVFTHDNKYQLLSLKDELGHTSTYKNTASMRQAIW